MGNLPKQNQDEIWLRIKSLNTGRHGEQKELMDFCGIPPNTYNNWSTGVSRSYMKYLSRIASFYNVSAEWILNGDQWFFSKTTSKKMCDAIVAFWDSGKTPAVKLFIPGDIERAIYNRTYQFSNVTYPQFGKLIGIPMEFFLKEENTSESIEGANETISELLSLAKSLSPDAQKALTNMAKALKMEREQSN